MNARARLLPLLLAAAIAAAPGRVSAYDPATTHAGLTQRAALASALHAALVKRFGRPLGLFEPVPLTGASLPDDERLFLKVRLDALDPAGGYRPGDDGVATSIAWLVAGSVIAWTPAERGQNSFYDPSRGAGLRQGGGLGELGQSLRSMFDGGSLRGWATGTDFNLDGPPSTAWVQSAQNDVGLTTLYDQLERSVAAGDRTTRNTALARALMAMGGVLAVLQDAGEPARVRNDFRGAFLSQPLSGSPGPFNRGSAFERFVADNYGIAGVPAAGKPVERPTVIAYFTGTDSQGLADRTQRRFYSAGTLPEDGVVDRDTSSQEVLLAARDSLTYGLPGLPRLELRQMGRKQYVYAVGDEQQGRLVLTSHAPRAAKPGTAAPNARRLLAYERVPGHVRFFMDRAVYQDTARTLLPEVGAYCAGLIDHLLRGEAAINVEGGNATVTINGARGAIRSGQLRLFADDAAGARKQIGSWPASAVAGGQSVSVAVPAGTRQLAAVLRGEDDAGVLVAAGEQSTPGS
jgi:hypothetical protein